MKNMVRMATWNLDHASNKGRQIARQIETIVDINPDIIVLTETCDAVDLSPYRYACALTEKNGYGNYWSAVWSRFPIVATIPTYHPENAVCARIDLVDGHIIVYGTIITYGNDKGPDGKSEKWEEHYKEIGRQGMDWTRIRKEDPGVPFCVAGDFNQTRDGSNRGYGTLKGRNLLTDQLERNNLVCLTTENFGEKGILQPDPKKGWARNNIDHICLSRENLHHATSCAWDHFTTDGVYLSDHNGVYVDIVFSLQ